MPPPPPPFAFTVPNTLSAFSIPLSTYLDLHPQYDVAASGVLVFAYESGQDKVLLLQRAPHDSIPNRWETPGGAIDAEDETILHGVARELWEESGLVVKSFKRQVGAGQLFHTSKEKLCIKLTFLVDVERYKENGKLDEEAEIPEVAIDRNEHQRIVWASEEECRQREVTDLEIHFTSQAQQETILEGFRVMREERGNSL